MTDWETRLNVAGITFLSLAFYNGLSVALNPGPTVLTGLMLVLFLILGVLALHASSLGPAPTHTSKSLLLSYFIFCLIGPVISKFTHRRVLASMKHPQKQQDKVLMSILAENGQTAFGRDHGLGNIKSRQEFLKNFPLTKFDTYEKYSDRIADGEQNVMTRAKVVNMITSSGTTGKNKLYPLTKSDVGLVVVQFGFPYMHTLNQIYCPNLSREFDFSMYHPVAQTKGGLKITGIGLARSFRKPQSTSPLTLPYITKEGPSYFVQALFSLRDPYVGFIQGASSDLMFAFFKSVEFNKDAICEAMATGCIESVPGLDDVIRQELNKKLIPDPGRAEIIKSEIEKGDDALALRVWPNLKGVFVGRTGAFAHSAKLMQDSYLKGVIMFCGLHAATEGFFGMSMTVEDVMNEEYTFLTKLLFLEFIKLEDMDQTQPQTYLLSELEVGQLYELVVTNWHGLYRNRFGDVIKVVGYTENTPKYTFQYRTGQILNCAYDRTPEKVFYEALKKAEVEWGIGIFSYTSTESMHLEAVTGDKTRKNHYVAFIEVQEDARLTTSHESMLEKKLCESHQTYAEYRDQESIGPICIVQVVPGTFNGLRNVLWGNRPNLQYKTPRVLRNHEALLYLWNNKL